MEVFVQRLRHGWVLQTTYAQERVRTVVMIGVGDSLDLSARSRRGTAGKGDPNGSGKEQSKAKVWPENEERFRELVLCVSQKCANDPKFGSVKLNKILFL